MVNYFNECFFQLNILDYLIEFMQFILLDIINSDLFEFVEQLNGSLLFPRIIENQEQFFNSLYFCNFVLKLVTVNLVLHEIPVIL
jgi:hypothetical protein